MVHWGWLIIAFGAGTIFGFFLLAFMEVSREEKNKNKWWEE